MLRGFTADESVTKQQLKPGIVRRIGGYARPYRWDLAVFLLAAALDAVITVAIPVLLGWVIDRGVLPRRVDVVIEVAAVVAGLAIFDALLNFVQRWYTARVGQGLIYDLRTQVFAHVQLQPIAFFTRAQTGSLVSRLNTDVIGAQQAVTTTLVSTRVQHAPADPGAGHDALLLLAGHRRRAGADTDVHPPGPARRPAGCSASPGSRCSSTPSWARS